MNAEITTWPQWRRTACGVSPSGAKPQETATKRGRWVRDGNQARSSAQDWDESLCWRAWDNLVLTSCATTTAM